MRMSPASGIHCVFNRGRKAMLWSKSIVHGEHGMPRRDGQLAADVIVGVEVTDHEPSPMEVHAQPGALERWAIEASRNTSGVHVTNFW